MLACWHIFRYVLNKGIKWTVSVVIFIMGSILETSGNTPSFITTKFPRLSSHAFVLGLSPHLHVLFSTSPSSYLVFHYFQHSNSFFHANCLSVFQVNCFFPIFSTQVAFLFSFFILCSNLSSSIVLWVLVYFLSYFTFIYMHFIPHFGSGWPSPCLREQNLLYTWLS